MCFRHKGAEIGTKLNQSLCDRNFHWQSNVLSQLPILNHDLPYLKFLIVGTWFLLARWWVQKSLVFRARKQMWMKKILDS